MESKRSVPKMVMTISTVMTVIEEVITGANCTQPYRHHNEEKYTKYINTQMHKITIFSKCFSKIESGSACSTCTSATAQMVWAQESALQLSDTLCYKVKSKSEEAEFSRAIVLKAQTILSTSLKAQAYIKKQNNTWRKDCWSELDFRKGKKEFKMPAKLDSWLKHCHSHDHR